MNSDWGIGCDGKQTIVIPEDRNYFREVTDGGVVIVGRKTFESLGMPLFDRRNIILTQDKDYRADGAITVHSAEEVLAEVAGDDPESIFVIGGGEIYKLFLPLCLQAYVTKIEASPASDTFFPDLDDLPEWSLESEFGIRNPEPGISFSFCTYRNNAVQMTPDP